MQSSNLGPIKDLNRCKIISLHLNINVLLITPNVAFADLTAFAHCASDVLLIITPKSSLTTFSFLFLK